VGVEPFADIVTRYLSYFARDNPQVKLERLLFTEDRLGVGPTVAPQPVDAAAFAPRFEHIRANLSRTWMNLAVEDLLADGTLVLTIEYFPGSDPPCSPDQVSVVFSGLPTQANRV
jgi:hypothetical protein